MSKLKLKNFSNYPEAEMAVDILKQSGISSFIKRTNRASAITEGSSPNTGESDLWVNEKDNKQAKEIIDEYFKN